MRGDSLRPRIQRAVACALLVGDERHSLRRHPHPLREQLVHARHPRFRLRLTAVPADQDLPALLPSEERKAGEAAIRIGRGAL